MKKALMLSSQASKIKVWEEVGSAYNDDGEVGHHRGQGQGGSVDLGGIIAFCPALVTAPIRH
jgi:hypothetical protein